MGGGLLPRVVENMLDAKVELDGRLRTVINDFTTNFASRITASISGSAATKRDFTASTAVQQIHQTAEREVPLLRRKLDEYLDDPRTKETLVGAVQDQVIQNYETFYERVSAAKQPDGRTVSRKGKGREDEVWDVDTFAEWVSGVFEVGRMGFGGKTIARLFSVDAVLAEQAIEIQQLRSELNASKDAIKKQHDQLQICKDELSSGTEELQNICSQHAIDNQQLRSELNQHVSEKQQLHSELNELRLAKDTTQADFHQLQTCKDALLLDKEELQSACNQHTIDDQQLRVELDALHQSKQSIEEDFRQLRICKDALSSGKEELQDTYTQQTTEIQ
ncbi:MAG: hypothetical protein Q9187_001662 [Circinaria calcarea]